MGCVHIATQSSEDTLPSYKYENSDTVQSPTTSSTLSINSGDSVVMAPLSIFSPRYHDQTTMNDTCTSSEDRWENAMGEHMRKPRLCYPINSNSMTVDTLNNRDRMEQRVRKTSTLECSDEEAIKQQNVLLAQMELQQELSPTQDSIEYMNHHCYYHDYHETNQHLEEFDLEIV
eukprot:17517_1